MRDVAQATACGILFGHDLVVVGSFLQRRQVVRDFASRDLFTASCHQVGARLRLFKVGNRNGRRHQKRTRNGFSLAA